MKKDIHPKENKCIVKCACGNTFETISTLKSITVEICNECHPYYTGQRRFVDTEGRIDIFKKRMQKAEAAKKQEQEISSKKTKKTEKKVRTTNEQNLKDILAEVRSTEPEIKEEKKVIRTDKIEEKEEKTKKDVKKDTKKESK